MPILQRKCQGCHQPAKTNGKLNLTAFDALKRGGTSRPLFEPGKPGEGTLLDNVTGKPPAMPPNAPPLADRWLLTEIRRRRYQMMETDSESIYLPGLTLHNVDWDTSLQASRRAGA